MPTAARHGWLGRVRSAPCRGGARGTRRAELDIDLKASKFWKKNGKQTLQKWLLNM